MRGFVFIHIPKNAGQSIKKALTPFNSACSERCTFSANDYIDKMGWSIFRSLFSFAIVRNPWDRQVSFYHFIINTTSHYLHDKVKHLTFEEYIQTVLPFYKIVNESQKQYVFTNDNKLLVNFVGRFETLDLDFQTICSRIRIDVHLPKLNSTSHKHYRTYYDETTRKIVGKLFERDVSTFNYVF